MRALHERTGRAHWLEIIGRISPKTFQNAQRKPAAGAKSLGRILFIVFETFMSFISRMHIAGIIKQASLALERKLRNVASTFLEHTLLRNPVVTINGINYFLPDARLESFFTLFTDYEKYVWRYLEPAKGDVFVDVGAHVGKYTLQVARIVGDEGLVIAVEPHPKNYRALVNGIGLNGFRNVDALNIAAWDSDCRLRLFIHEASTYHSAKIDKGLGYVEVEARAMDHVIVELRIKKVDWIKIDVEDAETEVLRGFGKTLAMFSPRLVVEVQYRNLLRVKDIMKDCGYAIMPIPGEQNPKDKVGYFYGEPVSI